MVQLPLPFDPNDKLSKNALVRSEFSHKSVSPQEERLKLEEKYKSLLEETYKFDRQLVSYQGNRDEALHSWIKYREGFSAELVHMLLDEFKIKAGETILEPFSGSATTLLVAKTRGINAIGVEILPVCHLTWEAKTLVYDYDLNELEEISNLILKVDPKKTSNLFPHIAITDTAFSPETENDLMFYTEWFQELDISINSKKLLQLILSSILEEISYTRKDGQYLRWDRRSEKTRRRNKKRAEQGKKLIKGMHKGDLPSVKEALTQALQTIIDDISSLQSEEISSSYQELIRGTSLEVLPTLESNQFSAVITSPPYCNRYDYTRTYALELAYLGVGENGIRDLRQNQLSCTVEHRSKVEHLRAYYQSLRMENRFNEILDVVQSNAVFREINNALQIRWERGEINNQGILPMVEGYFTELTFIFAEIFRTCRSKARVAFVNDNVRYGGEIVPVDLLSTDLAKALGFEPIKVYVLPQRKGNSSQQMKKFGREPLRKSITIWQKP